MALEESLSVSEFRLGASYLLHIIDYTTQGHSYREGLFYASDLFFPLAALV